MDHLDTPIGRLAIVASGSRLRAVGWSDRDARMQRDLKGAQLVRASNPAGLTAALRAYFAGDLHAIDGLPVELHGTPFQTAVWSALREIPCGETVSYGELARRIGKPAAVRAVGLANGANPVGVVLPCHRVIGADGELTGYGGGLPRKRWLLAHEKGQQDLPRLDG
jgi:methylated-DNA-[protein]-cysteine S-methyltransferase